MVAALTQKKGWVWKRLRHCPPEPKQPKYNQAKLADGLMLQQWAQSELICLKYVDESGFERKVHSITAIVVAGNKSVYISQESEANGLVLWEYGNHSSASIIAWWWADSTVNVF